MKQHYKKCITIWTTHGIIEEYKWIKLFPYILIGQEYQWYLAHQAEMLEWKKLEHNLQL